MSTNAMRDIRPHHGLLSSSIKIVSCPHVQEGSGGTLKQPTCAQVLLSSVVECWDKLRETSISVLMCLETPLPGIADPAAAEGLVLWAHKLVGSPRVRESDAGQPTSYSDQANWTC